MPFFLNQTPWQQKPVEDGGLNVEIDLYNGLSRAYNFHENADGGSNIADFIRDSSDARDHLTVNDTTYGMDSEGSFSETSTGTDDGIYQATPASVHAGKITLLAVGRFKRTGTTHQVICADSATTGERDFQFRFTAGNKLEFIPFVGGTPYTTTGATSKTTTDVHVAAATYDGETAKVFLDGVEDATNTSPSGNLDADGARLCIGVAGNSTSSYPSNNTDHSNTHYYQVYIWKRALSVAEIKYISSNPWILRAMQEELVSYTAEVGGVFPTISNMHRNNFRHNLAR